MKDKRDHIAEQAASKIDQKETDLTGLKFQIPAQRSQDDHVVEQMLDPEMKEQAGEKPVIFMVLYYKIAVHGAVLHHKHRVFRIPEQ